MRKILLATTALVAFAGAAQAAPAPVSVSVGGYVDFRAAQFHESNATATDRRNHDFETEYRLNIEAQGKAANGIEYGGLISLWNGADYDSNFENGGTTLKEDQAYVWMSGAFGKLILGDDHGASDLFVYAPTVGEGQIDGTYTDFVDPATLKRLLPSFIDNTENSTKLSYYTPKVGNADHKVQLGASYTPNFYNQGQSVVKYNSVGNTAYQDVIEGAVQYTGNFSPVNTVLSANITSGNGEEIEALNARDFTSWGIGGQAMYNGFTVGASYVDAGHYATAIGQNKDQDVWSVGVKYEFDKVALALNGMKGQGYNNVVAAAALVPTSYVKDFAAEGFGATYTWFPGLTSAFDGVLFQQKTDAGVKDDGYVAMLSQKITF